MMMTETQAAAPATPLIEHLRAQREALVGELEANIALTNTEISETLARLRDLRTRRDALRAERRYMTRTPRKRKEAKDGNAD